MQSSLRVLDGKHYNTNSNYSEACKDIALRLQNSNCLEPKGIAKIIKQVCSKYRLSAVPSNENILKYLPSESSVRKLLRVRPVKSASGVAVIALMPKPFECPQGRCIYCPGGVESNTPLSYTGAEPCTKYAQKFDYDPLKQIQSKLDQLYSRGHKVDKVELVIVGGTFPFFPEDYQRNFAKSCYDALNNICSYSLHESMMRNEKAASRCVGLTVETKPDYCKYQHIDLMLELGVTRVEIGVQSLQEETYRLVNRGHNLADVVEAFSVARDSGFKIVAHMMPGLPCSSPTKDINDFYKLFEDTSFKPDMLKIYPTLVLRDTGLYELYRRGKYSPYSDDDFVKILVQVKKMVPPWVRIMRVQREIEAKDILAGPKDGNLRQSAFQKLHEQGIRCKCIRCREVGLQKRILLSQDDFYMNRIDYIASHGQEVFLSFESKDKLTIVGFLRLRNPKSPHRKELKEEESTNYGKSAMIRELHVYGTVVNIGNRPDIDSYQHKGYGTKLIQEAERIVKDDFGLKRISVISAVGTRQYYKKMGYSKNGPYMTKNLL